MTIQGYGIKKLNIEYGNGRKVHMDLVKGWGVDREWWTASVYAFDGGKRDYNYELRLGRVTEKEAQKEFDVVVAKWLAKDKYTIMKMSA